MSSPTVILQDMYIMYNELQDAVKTFVSLSGNLIKVYYI